MASTADDYAVTGERAPWIREGASLSHGNDCNLFQAWHQPAPCDCGMTAILAARQRLVAFLGGRPATAMSAQVLADIQRLVDATADPYASGEDSTSP